MERRNNISHTYRLDYTYARKKAKAQGLKMVVPRPNQLTIDLDEPTVPLSFYQTLDKLSRLWDLRIEKITSSKSGNKHIYLKTGENFTPAEKIAIQAILGSDPVREFLSLYRAQHSNLGAPSLLFEVPSRAPFQKTGDGGLQGGGLTRWASLRRTFGLK
jgi:hypothetical protein